MYILGGYTALLEQNKALLASLRALSEEVAALRRQRERTDRRSKGNRV